MVGGRRPGDISQPHVADLLGRAAASLLARLLVVVCCQGRSCRCLGLSARNSSEPGCLPCRSAECLHAGTALPRAAAGTITSPAPFGAPGPAGERLRPRRKDRPRPRVRQASVILLSSFPSGSGVSGHAPLPSPAQKVSIGLADRGTFKQAACCIRAHLPGTRAETASCISHHTVLHASTMAAHVMQAIMV